MLLAPCMEGTKMRTAHRFAATVLALLAVLCWTGASSASLGRETHTRQPPPAGEALSAAGVRDLRSILSAAKLADLRWPDFSQYKSCIYELYADNGDRLVWIDGSRPTAEARAMIRVLENADAKGLVAADYDAPRWPARLAEFGDPTEPSESEQIRFDVALSVSAMRYISDLHLGRVDPRIFHNGFDVERKTYDLARFLLGRLVHANDIQPALREIEPPFPAYRRTLEALTQYRKLAFEYKAPPFPVPKKSVKPGAGYAALPQLAHLLRLLGDLPPNAHLSVGGTYQGAIVDAVKQFQIRHGLDPDGILGRQTFGELNTPLSHRVVQLQLSLERWRWLPHQFSRPPIIVNIPEFRLHAIDAAHRQELSMKVVVGKVYGHETPVFATTMESVIFRPYWNVPYSIQRRELVPALRKHPNYFLKHNYEVVDARRNVLSNGTVNPKLLKEIRRGTAYVRQRPGPKNSLGLVKFDMPNPYDIYMHGTPATSLFSKSRRDFSHGCIRVEDPVALALWVLRDNPGWTLERVLKAMHGDRTFAVKLARPIPVLIVYGTAIVAESGRVYFFRDIYGLDAELEHVLARGRPYPRPARTVSRP